ncbi:MAG: DMT family transporter [Myxococcales bacterium]|nr:DMT family transporter [Myxococcales bacterium]
MTDPRPSTLVLGLGGAVTAISSAALFILLAEPLPSSVIAAGRVTVTGVALLLLLGARALRSTWTVLRRPSNAVRVAVAAALLALHFEAWVASLTMTSVPRSVTLVATQPLFAGLLGRLVGDRAPWSLYLGAGLALVGTLLMVGEPTAAIEAGFNLGDGLALLAGAAAAGYLVVGRSIGQQVPLRPYLGAVHLGAALLLGLVVLLTEPDPWPSGAGTDELWVLLYLGLVPGVIGHGLINWAVRSVPVHVVALAVLFEPIGSTLLTVLVLGHAVGWAEAMGAGVLLAGVAVGLPRRRAV